MHAPISSRSDLAVADTEKCRRVLRDATDRVIDRLAGRPAWEMSRSDQMRLARLASKYLRARGAAKVRLFGSAAHGRRLGVHSDFDFAVEGLAPDQFFGALGELLQCLPLPVDLVELESAPLILRDRIVREGILL